MILYVGPAIGAHPPFEREIDLKGNLLMPGFKNAHAHSAMTFLRSYADDLPLQSWLFDKGVPAGGQAHAGRYLRSHEARDSRISQGRHHERVRHVL